MTVNNRLEEARARSSKTKVAAEIFRPVITIIRLKVIWARGGTRAARAPYAADLHRYLCTPFSIDRPCETSDRRLMFKTVVPWKESRIVEREAATRFPLSRSPGKLQASPHEPPLFQ